MLIGPARVGRATNRVPSGERFKHQRSELELSANRNSSGPRPFVGSKAETANCFPSWVGSPIAHRSDGDLAQVSLLPELATNNRCEGPPVIGTLMTGSCAVSGSEAFSPGAK